MENWSKWISLIFYNVLFLQDIVTNAALATHAKAHEVAHEKIKWVDETAVNASTNATEVIGTKNWKKSYFFIKMN